MKQGCILRLDTLEQGCLLRLDTLEQGCLLRLDTLDALQYKENVVFMDTQNPHMT